MLPNLKGKNSGSGQPHAFILTYNSSPFSFPSSLYFNLSVSPPFLSFSSFSLLILAPPLLPIPYVSLFPPYFLILFLLFLTYPCPPTSSFLTLPCSSPYFLILAPSPPRPPNIFFILHIPFSWELSIVNLIKFSLCKFFTRNY